MSRAIFCCLLLSSTLNAGRAVWTFNGIAVDAREYFQIIDPLHHSAVEVGQPFRIQITLDNGIEGFTGQAWTPEEFIQLDIPEMGFHSIAQPGWSESYGTYTNTSGEGIFCVDEHGEVFAIPKGWSADSPFFWYGDEKPAFDLPPEQYVTKEYWAIGQGDPDPLVPDLLYMNFPGHRQLWAFGMDDLANWSAAPISVPEPSGWMLLGLGGLLMVKGKSR